MTGTIGKNAHAMAFFFAPRYQETDGTTQECRDAAFPDRLMIGQRKQPRMPIHVACCQRGHRPTRSIELRVMAIIDMVGTPARAAQSTANARGRATGDPFGEVCSE